MRIECCLILLFSSGKYETKCETRYENVCRAVQDTVCTTVQVCISNENKMAAATTQALVTRAYGRAAAHAQRQLACAYIVLKYRP